MMRGELQDPSKARLLQDYGSTWHSRISRPSAPQGNGVQVQPKQGSVNAAFADGGARRVRTNNYELGLANSTPNGP